MRGDRKKRIRNGLIQSKNRSIEEGKEIKKGDTRIGKSITLTRSKEREKEEKWREIVLDQREALFSISRLQKTILPEVFLSSMSKSTAKAWETSGQQKP